MWIFGAIITGEVRLASKIAPQSKSEKALRERPSTSGMPRSHTGSGKLLYSDGLGLVYYESWEVVSMKKEGRHCVE